MEISLEDVVREMQELFPKELEIATLRAANKIQEARIKELEGDSKDSEDLTETDE